MAGVRDDFVAISAKILGVQEETLDNVVPPDIEELVELPPDSLEGTIDLYEGYHQFFHQRNPESVMTRVYMRSLALTEQQRREEVGLVQLVDMAMIPAMELSNEIQLLRLLGPKEELRELYNDMIILLDVDKEQYEYLLQARDPENDHELPSLDQFHVLTATAIRTNWQADTLEEFVKKASGIPDTVLHEMIATLCARAEELRQKIAML